MDNNRRNFYLALVALVLVLITVPVAYRSGHQANPRNFDIVWGLGFSAALLTLMSLTYLLYDKRDALKLRVARALSNSTMKSQ